MDVYYIDPTSPLLKDLSLQLILITCSLAHPNEMSLESVFWLKLP